MYIGENLQTAGLKIEMRSEEANGQLTIERQVPWLRTLQVNFGNEQWQHEQHSGKQVPQARQGRQVHHEQLASLYQDWSQSLWQSLESAGMRPCKTSRYRDYNQETMAHEQSMRE
jgi:hypothetical protein